MISASYKNGWAGKIYLQWHKYYNSIQLISVWIYVPPHYMELMSGVIISANNSWLEGSQAPGETLLLLLAR